MKQISRERNVSLQIAKTRGGGAPFREKMSFGRKSPHRQVPTVEYRHDDGERLSVRVVPILRVMGLVRHSLPDEWTDTDV